MATDKEPISDHTEEMLDHSPLTFGMYKGKTPAQVSEDGPRGEKYIRWLYETVDNKPTCSAALYKACGGTSFKAGPTRNQQVMAAHKAASSGDSVHRKPDKFGFDGDVDDDIPF